MNRLHNDTHSYLQQRKGEVCYKQHNKVHQHVDDPAGQNVTALDDQEAFLVLPEASFYLQSHSACVIRSHSECQMPVK